jgi:O-antigen/teichoic acid export membrane protein
VWVVRGRALFERHAFWPGSIEGFWKYILFAGIAKGGDVLRVQTPLVLIAAAGSLEAAALYALVMTLQGIANAGLVGVIDSAGPRLAAVASKRLELIDKLRLLAPLLGSLAALFGIGFFLTGESFILVWAHPADSSNILGPFVQLLALSVLIGAGRLLVVSSFRAQGRMEFLATGNFAEGVVSASLGILLLAPMGIVGPLVAQVGVSAVYLLIAVPLCMHKASLITHRVYFWACYGRPLFAAVLGAIPLAITVRLVSIETWPVLIAVIGGGGGVMAGVMYFVGFPQSIRGEILVRVKDIRGR